MNIHGIRGTREYLQSALEHALPLGVPYVLVVSTRVVPIARWRRLLLNLALRNPPPGVEVIRG